MFANVQSLNLTDKDHLQWLTFARKKYLKIPIYLIYRILYLPYRKKTRMDKKLNFHLYVVYLPTFQYSIVVSQEFQSVLKTKLEFFIMLTTISLT